MIDTLLVYAAGFGKRMMPLTQNCPKPLLEINNKPMLYHALDLATKFPFKKIYVNSHYLAEHISSAVDEYKKQHKVDTEISILFEKVISETGGTVKKFYDLFKQSDAIFTINSDSIITSQCNIWQEMVTKWDPKKMDFLICISPLEQCYGSVGKGDFDIDLQGKLNRDNAARRFMSCGLQIIKPKLVSNNDEDIFSLSKYYTDSSIRLYGYQNQGNFYHVSNPKDYQHIKSIIGFGTENLVFGTKKKANKTSK